MRELDVQAVVFHGIACSDDGLRLDLCQPGLRGFGAQLQCLYVQATLFQCAPGCFQGLFGVHELLLRHAYGFALLIHCHARLLKRLLCCLFVLARLRKLCIEFCLGRCCFVQAAEECLLPGFQALVLLVHLAEGIATQGVFALQGVQAGLCRLFGVFGCA